MYMFFFFFSSRRRHTRSLCDWSSDVCSSDLPMTALFSHSILGSPQPATTAQPITADKAATQRMVTLPMTRPRAGLLQPVAAEHLPQLRLQELSRRRMRHLVDEYNIVGQPPFRHLAGEI